MFESLSLDDEVATDTASGLEAAHPLCQAVAWQRIEAERELACLEQEKRQLTRDLGELAHLSASQLAQRLASQKALVDVHTRDYAMTDAANHMYEKFSEKSRAKGACQFCRKDFSSDACRARFEDSVERLRCRLPQFLEDTRSRCEAANTTLAALEARRSSWERLAKVRSESPRKRHRVAELNELECLAQRCAMQARVGEDIGTLASSSEMSDVSVVVEGVRIPAHRAVLMARSRVFDTMFRTPMVEQATGTVTLAGVSEVIAHRLLHFLYSGIVKEEFLTDDADAFALLHAAHQYDVPVLVQACAEAIVKRLDTENAAEFLQEANVLGCDAVRVPCLSYITEHIAEVQTTDGFERLAKKHPDLMLSVVASIAPPTKKKTKKARIS